MELKSETSNELQIANQFFSANIYIAISLTQYNMLIIIIMDTDKKAPKFLMHKT